MGVEKLFSLSGKFHQCGIFRASSCKSFGFEGIEPPAQLTASSSAGAPTVPDRILSSPDMGSADGFAFFPAPATSPLYSSLP